MRIAVLGSGNGGYATAFECAQGGHEVSIFGFPHFGIAEKAAGIAGNDGLTSHGVLEGHVNLRYVGGDMGSALEGAELVYVVGPAMATAPLAREAAPHLHPEQTVVVMPGSCLGAVAFKHALGLDLRDESWTIAETSTLPYAVRVTEPGVLRVFHRLRAGVYLAALPRDEAATNRVLALIGDVYPEFEPASSVLQTALQNGNPVIHPAVTLLNAALIERTGGDFLFYEEGVTQASGRLMEAVDRERMAIAQHLCAPILSEPAIGVRQGYMSQENYTTGYSQAPGFLGISAQDSLDHRYLTEDVGFSLVFFVELAKRAGVKTPVMDAVIQIASVVNGTDYALEPQRTLAGLGLGDWTLEQLREL